MGKPEIACEHCAAPVDRSEDGTLRHSWDFEDPDTGQQMHGMMIGYRCPEWLAKHPIHSWGRLRVVVVHAAQWAHRTWGR